MITPLESRKLDPEALGPAVTEQTGATEQRLVQEKVEYEEWTVR